MELTQKERRELILDIADEVCRRLDKKLKGRLKPEEEEWVSLKEAAGILGLSKSRMYAIKDKFPHAKQGDNPQGKLLFLKRGLVDNYLS